MRDNEAVHHISVPSAELDVKDGRVVLDGLEDAVRLRVERELRDVLAVEVASEHKRRGRRHEGKASGEQDASGEQASGEQSDKSAKEGDN